MHSGVCYGTCNETSSNRLKLGGKSWGNKMNKQFTVLYNIRIPPFHYYNYLKYCLIDNHSLLAVKWLSAVHHNFVMHHKIKFFSGHRSMYVRAQYLANIKTHGSESRGQEATKRTPQINVRGHYCELFTCRDGFAIFARITQSLSIVLYCVFVIKKKIVVVVLVVFLSQPRNLKYKPC